MRNKILAVVFILVCISSPELWGSLSNATELFSSGERAFKNQNFEQAAANFSRAVKFAPQDLRTRFRLGQSLFSLNKFSESYNQFQTVLQNSPNNIVARVYLSENLIKLGRLPEARSHLEWILKVQPGHDRAVELLKNSSAKISVPVQTEIPGKEEIPDGFQPLPVKKSKLDLSEAERIEAAPRKIKGQKMAKNSQPKGLLPPEAKDSPTWDVAEFFKTTRESFMINLEYGRYAIEKGDLLVAREKLMRAEELARTSQDTRKFLEVQILTSLVLVYSKDFASFGKHLMKLKPLLSANSYKSFLEIYNQARELKGEVELARLSAGIAMGAGHYAVAVNLLKEALNDNPGDLLILNLLAEAQMQNLDYQGAERTLSEIARADQKNADSYFNLARFYLTASYKPEMARKCAEYAKSLKSQDPRISVTLALLDYTEGKIEVGIARLKQLLPEIKDPGFKAICSRIIEDGKYADQVSGAAKVDFAEVLALPGAQHAPKSSFRIIATDYLKRGSFFSAMKFFLQSQDLAEVGRTYLGLSSALHLGSETESAAIAAGFGLKAIRDELQRNPNSGRANLYLALYFFERNEFTQANSAVSLGLKGDSERGTRKRLTALLDSLNKQSRN